MYIALKYELWAVLFFWTSRIELAESKYEVFWGVTKICPEKLAVAKMENRGFSGNSRTRQGIRIYWKSEEISANIDLQANYKVFKIFAFLQFPVFSVFWAFSVLRCIGGAACSENPCENHGFYIYLMKLCIFSCSFFWTSDF